ncbi:MAG TPA: hypothetical protein VLN59_13300, partial [Burkholderiales bacterium]|nr:hypothetical protein [Burkholderiales bacterium]
WLLTLRLLIGIIDTKDDFGWLLQRPDVLLLDEAARWNPLALPPFLSVRAHATEVRDVLNARFYGGQWQAQILDAALLRLYDRTITPSLHDLVDEIRNGAPTREAPMYAESRRSTIARLERFADEALFTTRNDGLTWETLLSHSFVLRSRAYDDVARFKFDLLTRYAYLAHRAAHITVPTRVFAFDEGNDLLTSHQDGIKAVEPLHQTKQLSREWGIGFVDTSVTLDHLAALAKTSTNFTIALRPNNPDEARAVIRTLGLNAQQMTTFLHRMTIGDALLRTAVWPEVVHLKIGPNTEPKYATPEDIRAARERTNQRARPPLLLPAITTASSNPSPNTAAASAMQPPSTTPAEPLPLVLEAPIAHNGALLTTAQRHFLTINCELGVATVVEMYDRCKLKPMQGDRIKKTLINLGLISATRITVGASRGKQATALMPTDTAYQMLGKTRPKLGRGSGPQHAWILRTLSARIPHATIETNGADIGIAYNTSAHAHLIATLHATGANEIALNTGNTIAIEVELDPARTARQNLDRDRNYNLVIIATPKQQLTTAARVAKQYQNAIIVDVYALLDALGERP